MAKESRQFESISLAAPTSITWASTGGDGSGKTTFSLGAPEPIFICAFDPYGVDRVNRSFKVREDGTAKDIRIARYPFDPQHPEAAEKTWNRFVEDYLDAIRNFRSVIWDREDVAWEALRYARFGDKSSKPADYGDLNAEYIGLIQKANAAKVNLGLLRGIREEWISKFDPQKAKMVGHNTGKLIPDGMKKVPDHVDITLLHYFSDEQKEFITRIGKFTEKNERGMEYPDLDWVSMATLAFPDSSENDWR